MITHQNCFVVDASVLFDYLKTGNGEILTLISDVLGKVIIPVTTLKKVPLLDRRAATNLGLTVRDPDFQVLIAAAPYAGRRDFDDTIAILMSKQLGCTCITNDKRMRASCRRSGVPVLWGLEVMLRLVKLGCLAAGRAESVARAIHEINPHITDAILNRFLQKIRML